MLIKYHYSPKNLEIRQQAKADGIVSVITFEYDAQGRLIEEDNHLGRYQHHYDANGNLIQTSYPDGSELRHHYYGTGHRLQSQMIRNGEHYTIADYERDTLHREIARSQGALTEHTNYDSLGRIIEKSSRRPNSLYGSAQLIRQYRYDAAHRLIQTQRIDLAGQPEEQRQLNQYRYDSIGQLISSLTDHQHHHYPTDPTGNQLDNTGQWVKANQVTKLGLYSYQYDDYGRLSQRLNHLTGEIQSHHYDAENRLVRIDYKNSRKYSRVHYDYDALNRRISKTIYGIEQASRPIITYYHWQGMQLIGEHLGSQSTAPIYYFYEAGSYTPIARLHCVNSVHQDIVAHNKSTEEELNKEFNLDLKTFQTKVLGLPETPETPHARDKLYYYHAEQNGLPVMLTDEAGQTVWQQTNPGARGKGAISGKPNAVYVTTLSPEELNASKARGQMGLTNSKSSHYISFEVDSSKLKRIDRQDGVKRLYIEEDISLRDANNKLQDTVEHGKC